jgi:hypothetical protein
VHITLRRQLLIKTLYDTLVRLYQESEKPFPGIGLLVCNDVSRIPAFPLYTSIPTLVGGDLYGGLLQLSGMQSPYHDGFHILSDNLEITHTAQYFYPNPIHGMSLDPHEHYGARYFVAKIGSVLPDILLTAVVGSNYGVCVFQNGNVLTHYNND